MLLGLLMAAGTPASTGCFNGGAFVGAQAGFTHVMLKRLAKDNAISKDVADKQVKLFADAIKTDGNYDVKDSATDKDTFAKQESFKDDTFFIKVDLSGLDKAKPDDVKAAGAKVVDEFKAAEKSENFKKAKKVQVVVLTKTGTTAFAAADLTGTDAVKDFAKDDAVKARSKSLVDGEAEAKYTSNNGFAGLHAGYLGRVNDKFLVGGLVEGNWVFGQDMKVDSKEVKDTKARFNVGAYLRAMFNLTEKFMAGADLGFSGQEIRQEKVVGQKDKESKWFWNPAARLVLGVTLTDNILATAHFGGVFPMIKQDSLRDSAVKAKYSNFHGGVGISYVFGG